ncbi:MAG: sulfotransferase domain-containing protein, partial [Chthoniobacterales bacterium]|nr:sulfotransferase domain-containing protein [Chthoniobacterales bacterium]
MIIWLASYPRSGNTFLRMLLHHSCGFKTYSTYNDPLFDQLGATDAVGQERLSAPLEELAKAPETYLVKTHDLPTDKSPAIYVVRDGRDSLVSLARYLLSFERKPSMMKTIKEMLGIDNFSTVLEELIIKKEHYGGWNDHVLTWLHRD